MKVNKRQFINSILPASVCYLCAGASQGEILCQACAADLPALGSACPGCAISLPVVALCPACQRRKPPFARCHAGFRYDFPLSGLIQQMKYHGQPGLCRALGVQLLPSVRERDWPYPDGLLPMPLHWRRMLVRGYNQALELARPLAAALDVPLLTGLCRRSRATRPQTRLAGRARQDNVRDAFSLVTAPPAHIAIIDDVMTSGHTAAALSRCLLAGGAKRVEIWVLARAG